MIGLHTFPVFIYVIVGFETVEHGRLVDETDEQMNVPNWVLSKTFNNTHDDSV